MRRARERSAQAKGLGTLGWEWYGAKRSRTEGVKNDRERSIGHVGWKDPPRGACGLAGIWVTRWASLPAGKEDAVRCRKCAARVLRPRVAQRRAARSRGQRSNGRRRPSTSGRLINPSRAVCSAPSPHVLPPLRPSSPFTSATSRASLPAVAFRFAPPLKPSPSASASPASSGPFDEVLAISSACMISLEQGHERAVRPVVAQEPGVER